MEKKKIIIVWSSNDQKGKTNHCTRTNSLQPNPDSNNWLKVSFFCNRRLSVAISLRQNRSRMKIRRAVARCFVRSVEKSNLNVWIFSMMQAGVCVFVCERDQRRRISAWSSTGGGVQPRSVGCCDKKPWKMITGGPLKYITSALHSPQHILIHEGVKEKGHFKHICVTEFLFTHSHQNVLSSAPWEWHQTWMSAVWSCLHVQRVIE